jgi:prevent-host-death family protein
LRKTHDFGAKYTITHNGQPFAVLMSTEEYEGLLETLEILENKNITRELLKSIREADEGKTVPFEKVVGRKQEK